MFFLNEYKQHKCNFHIHFNRRDTRERIMVQTELEEAGFDVTPLKRMMVQHQRAAAQQKLLSAASPPSNSRQQAPPDLPSLQQQAKGDLLKEEISRWNQNYIDVNNLVKKLLDAERANRKLREEVARLRLREEEREAAATGKGGGGGGGGRERDQDSSGKDGEGGGGGDGRSGRGGGGGGGAGGGGDGRNTVDRLRECCEHLQSEIERRTTGSTNGVNNSNDGVEDKLRSKSVGESGAGKRRRINAAR